MEKKVLLNRSEKGELLRVLDASAPSLSGLSMREWPKSVRWTGTKLHEAIVARRSPRPFLALDDYAEVAMRLKAEAPKEVEIYIEAGRAQLEFARRGTGTPRTPGYHWSADGRFYRIVDLGRAAVLSGDGKYVRVAERLIQGRWQSLPPMPRDKRKDSMYWDMMHTGHQLRNLIDFIYMAPLAEYIEDEVMAAILLMGHRYMNFARRYDADRYHFSNITFAGTIGAYCWAVLFPEYRDSAELRRYWAAWLRTNAKVTIRSDGGQYEQSPNYHNFTQHWLAYCYRHDSVNGGKLGEAFGERVGKAAEFFSHILLPNGETPPVGDTGLRRRDLSLAVTALTGGRVELLHGLKKVPGLYWHLGARWVNADFSHVKPPRQCTFAFPKSGFYVMRSGWDEDANYGLFLCGPHGMYHGHYNLLSLIVASDGKLLLGDPGSYHYDNSPARLGIMATMHHSTLSLDNISHRPFEDGQPRLARVTQWDESGRKIFCTAVSRAYDHLYGKPVLRRQIFFDGDGVWILVDRLRSSHMHAFTQNFIVTAGSAKSREHAEDDMGLFVTQGNGPRLAIVQANMSDVTHVYDRDRPYNARHYQFIKNTEDGCFVTMLAVLKGRTTPPLELKTARVKGGGISIAARAGGRKYRLVAAGKIEAR